MKYQSEIVVLLIDNDSQDAAETRALLQSSRHTRFTLYIEEIPGGASRSEQEAVDVVLVNLRPADPETEVLLEAVQMQVPGVPMIALIDSYDADYDFDLIEKYVYDFLPADMLNTYVLERAIHDVLKYQQVTEALEESEQSLSRLIDNLNGVAYRSLNDHERTFTFVSEGIYALTGYTPQDFSGDGAISRDRLIHPDDRPMIHSQVQTALENRESFQMTYRLKTRQGAEKWVQERGQGVFNGDGQAVALEGFITDFTEHRQREAREHDGRRFVDALLDASRLVGNTLDQDVVMPRFLHITGKVVPYDAASIMLIDKKDNNAMVRYCAGYTPEAVSMLQKQAFSLETAGLKYMIESGEPLYIRDAAHDAAEYTGRLEGARAYLGVPIVSQEQVIGFLHLESRLPDSYTPVQIERLQSFASLAASAMENAFVFGALNRHAIELEMLYRAISLLFRPLDFSDGIVDSGQQIADAVVQTFEKVDCGVMLIDQRKSEINRVARSGEYNVQSDVPLSLDGGGLVPEAIRTRKVVYSSDVLSDSRYVVGEPRTRSELVIPLEGTTGVLGVLDLQSTELNAFGISDQYILKVFADHAAISIENARLYDQIRHQQTILEERIAERTEALSKSANRIEAILNSNSDPIILIHPGGVIQQTNLAFDNLFGYSIDEIYGQSLTRMVQPEYVEVLEAAVQRVVDEQVTERLDVVALTRAGRTFDVEIAFSFVADDETTAIVCNMRDITIRKKAEDALRAGLERERELNDLKTRFISMVSHEFRTPLTAIQMSAESLERYLDRMDEEKRKKRFNTIEVQVRHMTALLEDVLTIGRIESGKITFEPGEFDLNELCRSIVHEFKITDITAHRFVYTFTGDEDILCADERLIRQIMTNLISNAVKYSPGGKTVTVDVVRDNQHAVLRVTDEGIGIPRHDQEKLFKAFYRGTNVGEISGTGLGLLITRQAVDMHQGSIRVESIVDEGTTFEVTIPAFETSPEH